LQLAMPFKSRRHQDKWECQGTPVDNEYKALLERDHNMDWAACAGREESRFHIDE
ncbi:Hypothetical predicted protein, partial [Marmota monax]